MKRKSLIVGITAIILVILVSVWLYGYHNRKSNDNLPSLTAIAQMDEAKVNSILPGYHIEQLREVWGKPDKSSNNEDLWKIDDKILIVNYNNLDEVVICGLKNETGASIGND